MRVKIDECLPREVAELLTRAGYEAETVPDEGLVGSPDEILWEAVQAENRFLITTDLDFSDVRRYSPGTHAGLMLLRLRKEGKTHIVSYFEWLLLRYDPEDWAGCLVVATDHRIRVRRPV